MLKITMTETPTEARWILQGRLIGPWVRELRIIWRKAIRNHKGRACIVDLNDVTFIDKGAEKLLRAMSREGAQFIADGLYIKHVLEGLKISRHSGLSRIIASFFAALLLSVIVYGATTRLDSEVVKMNAKHDAWTQTDSGNVAHASNSPTSPFKGMEDQDYVS